MEAALERFIGVFADLEDPRAANARHDLSEVLFIALAAAVCGAEGCCDMATFGKAKEALLRQVLRLPHGIPSHDTFSRVFRVLDPQAFETVFREFMAAFAKQIRGVVAIDGKALRGAFERGQKTTPLHLVNVWAAEQRLALAQRTAPNRNEVAAALKIVELLALKDCIVTADAQHCHAKMAKAIQARQGDYVLALKENQAALHGEALARFEADDGESFAEECRWNHDRLEQRRASVLAAADLAKQHGFPGLQAIARIEALRQQSGKPAETQTRYYVLSKAFPAERVLQVVRSHWGIENQLHWVLDVVFDEDAARNRKGSGPQNLAILRKLALNLLRSDQSKGSIRRKVKRAGWDNHFLISILSQMR